MTILFGQMYTSDILNKCDEKNDKGSYIMKKLMLYLLFNQK